MTKRKKIPGSLTAGYHCWSTGVFLLCLVYCWPGRFSHLSVYFWNYHKRRCEFKTDVLKNASIYVVYQIFFPFLFFKFLLFHVWAFGCWFQFSGSFANRIYVFFQLIAFACNFLIHCQFHCLNIKVHIWLLPTVWSTQSSWFVKLTPDVISCFALREFLFSPPSSLQCHWVIVRKKFSAMW